MRSKILNREFRVRKNMLGGAVLNIFKVFKAPPRCQALNYFSGVFRTLSNIYDVVYCENS